MRGAVTIAACLALAALPFAGCGDDDDGTSGSTQTATQQEKTTTQAEAVPAVVSVSIGDNFYKPKDVTIQVGQSVKWKNNGAVAHTVAPKATFRLLNMAYNVFPDSAAAKGETAEGGARDTEQIMLARMFKGVHW